MEPQRYKKTKILLLLLLISLLLHLIISFFFLEFGFRKRFTSFITTLSNSITSSSPEDKRIIEQKREHKHEALQKIFEAARQNKKPIKFIKPSDNRPAKLVAPKSNFGWVMFDNNYEKPKKLEIPTTKSGDLMSVKLANATETKPKKLESDSEPKTENTQVKPENGKLEQIDSAVKKQNSVETKQEVKQLEIPRETKIVETKIIKNKVDEAIKKDLDSSDKQILTIQEQKKPTKQVELSEHEQMTQHEQTAPIADRIKKIRQMQETVAQYQIAPKTKEQERDGLLGSILKKDKKVAYGINKQEKDAQEKNTDFVWGASSLKPKSSKNIIALTKGYIEKTQGENGTDLIDRDGDPNKRPSFEEMKYVSYEAKLNWCCQATWKQNSSFYSLPVASRDYQAVIEFSIDKNGNLINSEILESSGCKEVDSAIVKNLKATTPFPPLPKHFEKEIYTTGRIITVSINRMLF
jgi:TonB family protein